VVYYVNSGLSATRLKAYILPEDIQIIPIQLNVKNSTKWLVISAYRPLKQNLKYFLEHASNLIDFYKFDKCIVIGDLNSDPKHGNHDPCPYVS